VAKEISRDTMFPYDREEMYYFVREGYSKDPYHYSRHSEGFCKELTFISELLDGKVFIDGYWTHDLGLGEQFKVDIRPEHKLKCIRFSI